MAKYRKKPVVIEAIRWNGDNWDELYDFTRDSTGLSMLTGPHPQIEDANDYNERTYLSGAQALTKHNSRHSRE